MLRNSPRPRITSSPGGASQDDEDGVVIPGSRCFKQSKNKPTNDGNNNGWVRAEGENPPRPTELIGELDLNIISDLDIRQSQEHHIHGQDDIGEEEGELEEGEITTYHFR